MAYNDFVQNIVNTDTDAIAFQRFMQGLANEIVKRRIAGDINTLNYYLDFLHGLELVYSQPTGTVNVNGTQVKTVTQAIKDAINTASVANGVNANLVIYGNRTQADKNAERKSVKDSGAKGDGVTDDTTAINNALAGGGNILFNNGTYLFDATELQNVKDNTLITFEPNAFIQVKPNNRDRYYVFNCEGRKNIRIVNPQIIGDKQTHTGSTGQWGHGINLVNCQNVEIIRPVITKMWGDGIYVNKAVNTIIDKPLLDDNRRQGMSVIACDGLDVINPVFSNTSGQAPAYGVDIEVNWAGENCKKIRFFNPIFKNNGVGGSFYGGLAISTNRAQFVDTGGTMTDTTFEIELFNPKFYGDALLFDSTFDRVYGFLKVYNPEFYNSRLSALLITDHQSAQFTTEIFNPKFYDCVTLSSTIYDNPITIEAKSTNLKTSGTQKVKIYNPEFYSSTAKTTAIRNITKTNFTNELQNCEIINLKAVGYSNPFTLANGTTPVTPDPSFLLRYHTDGDFTDVGTSSNLTNVLDRTRVKYTGSTAAAIYYLNDTIPISQTEFYFVNQSSSQHATLTLKFGTSSTPTNIYADGLSNGRLCTGIVVPIGSFVKLKKVANNKWVVTGSSANVKTVEQWGVTATYDWPSLAVGAQQSTTVTVTGATINDIALVTINQSLNGTRLSAQVTANDTVTVTQVNNTAAAVDVASGIMTIKII